MPGEKWVAGEGPERRRLQAKYPNARWLNVLDGPELARVYRSADVMVFPSITDTLYLVMVESMACGTPVAAFPVPGPIDVIGNSAGGVVHTDLRQACLQALELPATKCVSVPNSSHGRRDGSDAGGPASHSAEPVIPAQLR